MGQLEQYIPSLRIIKMIKNKVPYKLFPYKANSIIQHDKILFTQPLRSGRIWHKVNFKRSLTGLNSEFSFS